MFKYVKKMEYPVNIQNKDLKMAKNLLAQYGGPDGEFAAAMRYLNQRFSMPDLRRADKRVYGKSAQRQTLQEARQDEKRRPDRR